MSWSLGETGALALKATRGAGFSWGVAEEAAAAVIWLEQHALPGAAALCSYLSWHFRQPAHTQAGTGTVADAGGACPLTTGIAIIDGIIEMPSGIGEGVELGRVRTPLLLLPFTAPLRIGDAAHLILEGVQMPLEKPALDSWQTHLLIGSAECRVHVGQRPQITNDDSAGTRLPDHYACCVDQLAAFAHHTYAPATSASRLGGAGAGLNDND
jgi:hypothetical protein